MNKLYYIQNVLNERNIKISENAIKSLIGMYDKQYFQHVNCSEELICNGLIYESSGKYIISDLGDEIVEKSAELFFESSGLTLDNKFQRKKRPITDEMKFYSELVQELLNPHIPIKLVKERRSNLDVKFFKKYKGIGRVEIMNSGILRLTVYKPDEKAFEIFNKEFGMTYRSTDIQTYFDTELNESNVRKLIELLLKYVGF